MVLVWKVQILVLIVLLTFLQWAEATDHTETPSSSFPPSSILPDPTSFTAISTFTIISTTSSETTTTTSSSSSTSATSSSITTSSETSSSSTSSSTTSSTSSTTSSTSPTTSSFSTSTTSTSSLSSTPTPSGPSGTTTTDSTSSSITGTSRSSITSNTTPTGTTTFTGPPQDSTASTSRVSSASRTTSFVPPASTTRLVVFPVAVSSDSALDNVAPPSIVIPVNSVSNDNVNNAATPSVDQVTVQNINGADANPTNSIVVPSSTFESVPGTLTASPSTATSASTSVISPTSIGIPVPPLSPSGSLKKGPKIALIIGLIIAFLILLFVLIVWLCRRKRQRETRQFMRRIHPFAEKYWLYPNVAQEKQLGHQAGDAASTLVGSDHGEGDVEKSPVAHVPPPIQVPIYRPETRSTSGSVSTVLPEYHALMTPMPPVYSRMSVDPFRV